MKTRYSNHYYHSTDGLRLHYRLYDPEGASAATYLCMPGLTRNVNDFNGIAEFLQQKGCRVICVSQRGRGNSEWDKDPGNYTPDVYVQDMFNLIENELNTPDDLYLIGTSLGGLMAIMMNELKPGMCKGIIINDVGMEIDPAGLDRIQSYVGVDKKIQTWDDAIAAVKEANAIVYPDYSDAEWAHFTRLLYVEKDGIPTPDYDPAIRIGLTQNTEQAAPTLWHLMPSLKRVPVVTLRGQLSDILSKEVAERMQNEHRNMAVIEVPGVGHCPTFETDKEKHAILRLSL